MCNTIDEIYDDLISLISENQTIIKEEDNNNSSICIKIPTKHPKIKEIIFKWIWNLYSTFKAL